MTDRSFIELLKVASGVGVLEGVGDNVGGGRVTVALALGVGDNVWAIVMSGEMMSSNPTHTTIINAKV